MNRNFATIAGGALFAGLATIGCATPASAGVVYTLNIFEDSNDNVIITTNSPQYAGTGGLIISAPESVGLISFSLDAPVPLLQTDTFLEGLIDGPNSGPGTSDPEGTPGSLSDALLIFETTGSATVNFEFASDLSDLSFIPADAGIFNQVELTNANYMTVIAGGTGSALIQPIITSETPEPSTLAVIGIALLSLFGLGAMRRRTDG